MAATVIIDLDVKNTPPSPTPAPLPLPPQDPKLNRAKSNIRKRKKDSMPLQNIKSAEEKYALIQTLMKELDGLFKYYKEVMAQKVCVELSHCGGSRNAVVAALMEESDLPLTRLVEAIHDKLNSEVGNGAIVLAEPVTYASVKSSVLFVGQRMVYGVPNADADILEDHADSCLWCWETRDVKLMPRYVRGQLGVRRTCRRRIHERIMAVSEMIASLKKLESEPDYNHGLMKASKKLNKAFNEADIRLLVDALMQKNSEDMAKKKANQENKLLVKQLERNRKEADKEKESAHSELQSETLLSESDLKLSQDEARNGEKFFEKRKQQKKQVEGAEKDQRRREKEEAELKKKRCLQKQASIMERFLKRSKIDPSSQSDKVPNKSMASDTSSSKSESVSESATISMDCTLASSSAVTLEDIRKLHFSSWRCLGQSIRSNRRQRWGLRHKPRTEVFKELKLTATKTAVHDDELDMEKHVDRLGEFSSDISSCPMNAEVSPLDAKKYSRGRQLLQFDNAHRPAFYGVWPTKSHIVGPRHPLRKDPSLDYDVSSDEEWEEEDPGESLSDCDKDEEECQEEGSKSDGESEDGFFVPDGYLSEDEGAQVDRMEIDNDIEGADSSPSCKDDAESEEFCALLRLQKYLNNLTEHALRKNQPLIISNLIHDKEILLLDHHISGAPKLEQMCLQALSMYIIPGCSDIEISMDQMQDKDQEACLSSGKGGTCPVSDVAIIPDSDLPIIVTTIQNCSQGMNKVLGSLQQIFPSVSKSLLKNKVREVSDYVDNRLQVKKEVLVKLGLAVKPEKSSGEPRSIAAFFSKRCLPPTGESVKTGETSPLPFLKSHSAIDERQQSSYNI
ncbi:chromatin assembly factor 1 subunit FAS1 isoform X2 [Abrus precatorius]|uniref:Chromatin assembly factor 1 subunit FAS1 isoform X2 n=1 Tax=Abrus precatorius TaxID=3816 RepID=A0A8B8LEA8_ABRPR|nr:chromatin assembly factor 1 subunit FAS1 isoform X2 [Abrus precatorius]